MTVYAEKLLPHDVEAEEAVLGSLLIDGQCITRLAPLLKGGDFYRERNQLCFDAAVALFQRDQAIDQLTLAGELARTGKLDLAGGMAYLSHLVSVTPTSVHAEDYAQAVSRTAAMRKLIDAGTRIIALGYNDTADLDATIREAEDALFAVRGNRPQKGLHPPAAVLRSVPPGAGRGRRSLPDHGNDGDVRVPRPGRTPGRPAAGRPGGAGGQALHGQEHPGHQRRRQRRQERPLLRHLQLGDDRGPDRHAASWPPRQRSTPTGSASAFTPPKKRPASSTPSAGSPNCRSTSTTPPTRAWWI